MTDLNNSLYYPMLVSHQGTADPLSHEEDTLVWKKFLSMSRLRQDILTDAQMPIKISELQRKLRLSEAVVGILSVYIRKIFFDELSLSDAETNLRNNLSSNGEDANKAQAIVDFIQKEILTIKPKPKAEEVQEEKKQTPLLVKLPLLQALSKYEQLGNQLISRERIKIKSQNEPVRPSLLYWIKYYRDELGVGHHDSVQRGDFLFRSENGKRLSPEERERVNLVLKSVEENFPVEIDTEQSTILFPAFIPSQPPRPVPQAAPVLQRMMPQRGTGFNAGGATLNIPRAASEQAGTLSFSSKHVLPAEKAQAAPEERVIPQPQSVPPRVTPRAPMPQSNPFHIRPVSLGKEE